MPDIYDIYKDWAVLQNDLLLLTYLVLTHNAAGCIVYYCLYTTVNESVIYIKSKYLCFVLQ